MIKIVHIDRTIGIREYVRLELSKYQDFRIVGNCDNSVELNKILHEFSPHFLLTNTVWKDRRIVNCIDSIKSAYPSMKIILLTMKYNNEIESGYWKRLPLDFIIGKHMEIESLITVFRS